LGHVVKCCTGPADAARRAAQPSTTRDGPGAGSWTGRAWRASHRLSPGPAGDTAQ